MNEQNYVYRITGREFTMSSNNNGYWDLFEGGAFIAVLRWNEDEEEFTLTQASEALFADDLTVIANLIRRLAQGYRLREENDNEQN